MTLNRLTSLTHQVSGGLLAALVCASGAAGALTSWNNPGVGDWYDPANWDCGYPVAGEVLWMENGGTATVTGGTSPVYSLVLCREGGMIFSGGVFQADGIRFGDTGTAFGELNGASTVINCDSMAVAEGSLGSTCFNHFDGTVNVAGELQVGFDGDGAYFQDAGVVNAGEINLAFVSGSVGQYTISGGEINAVDVFAGVGGAGSFIQYGGVVNIDAELCIPIFNGSGLYRLIGGELNVDQVRRSSSAISWEFRMTGGEFNVREFGQTALPMDLKVEGGVFTPGGASVGTSTIFGSIDHQTAATIRIDLAGAADADQVIVTDAVTLGGDLTLELGYAPAAMDSFVILDALGPDPITGFFGAFEEGSTVTGVFGGTTYNFAITYEGGDGNDVVIGACFGDATGDGVIDFDDLNLVLSNWGETGPEGDLNGSGLVDFDDLNLVLSAWDMDCV